MSESLALGARSFKSGPIQITADGSTVWVANADHDSVSKIVTANDAVTEFPLPQPPQPAPPIRHNPRGVSVREDGSEVWVACHDSDRVYVLSSAGAVLAQIDFPWGSGPFSVALSRDQKKALVTLYRAGKLAVIDTATRQITAMIDDFRTPLGIAWLEDGITAWVSHVKVNDRLTRVSRVDFSGASPRILTVERTDGAGPQDDASLHDPDPSKNVAEGGYLTFRGHLAQIPGGSRVWIPTQYGNRNQTVITPNGIIQAVIRQIDLNTRRIPGTNNDKIILSAKQIHDPSNGAWVGLGWDAPAAGPVDIGFSSDAASVYLLCELSENLFSFATNTPPFRSSPSQSLPNVTVGQRPQGLAAAPVLIGGKSLVYVLNSLSRSVSVVDVSVTNTPALLKQIAVTPLTAEPFSASFRNGERLFHSTLDSRASSNKKVACGSCHVYAEDEGRSWPLQFLPGNHGVRAGMSMLGLNLSFGPIDPATGLGQLHRSGDRDEVQDFDHTFRSQQMGGTGFIPAASLQPPLGPPNAGRDPDLDDIANYVLALPPLARSPRRAPGGALTAAAIRGATIFRGSGGKPADANCASCHIPETGFTDLKFHDVGSRHDAGENELNNRAPIWGVNTPSLVGLFASPPYVGVAQAKDAESLIEALLDFRAPGRTAPHGNLVGLTNRQMFDLEEFLASIDGNMTAGDVRNAADNDRPKLTRVEATSLTRVDAWFSESIAASAASASRWRLKAIDGPDVTISGVTLDTQNGDHLIFTVNQLHHDCGAVSYQLIPLGPIYDIADTVSGGSANALDTADPNNTRSFVVGDTLTITLGASGYENLTIPVHDSGTVFGNNVGANGAIWPRNNSAGQRNAEFLRFEWEGVFTSATGITDPNALLDGSFSLEGLWGDAQPLEIRRVLQRWWDYGGGDQTQNPSNPQNGHGGVTYRDSEFNVKAWNQPNAAARAAGVNGKNAADYFGTRDTAFDPDATATTNTIAGRNSFTGAGILDALRFWLGNTPLDQGWSLQYASGSTVTQETRFRSGEEELKQHGPVLTLTYRLPSTTSPPPPEVSPPNSPRPLLVSKKGGGDLDLSFDDLGGTVGGYNLYEGALGSWYSHSQKACHQTGTPIAGGRRQITITPAVGGTYYLITSYNSCVEGTSGSNSAGQPQPGANLNCAP